MTSITGNLSPELRKDGWDWIAKSNPTDHKYSR